MLLTCLLGASLTLCFKERMHVSPFALESMTTHHSHFVLEYMRRHTWPFVWECNRMHSRLYLSKQHKRASSTSAAADTMRSWLRLAVNTIRLPSQQYRKLLCQSHRLLSVFKARRGPSSLALSCAGSSIPDIAPLEPATSQPLHRPLA